MDTEKLNLVQCCICLDYYPEIGIEEHANACNQMQQYSMVSMKAQCDFCQQEIEAKNIESHLSSCLVYLGIMQGSVFSKNGNLNIEICSFCKEEVVSKFIDDHYRDCIPKLIQQSETQHQKRQADITDNQPTECAICILEFELSDDVEFLQCNHAYHKWCLDDWLKKKQGVKECPQCRRQFKD